MIMLTVGAIAVLFSFALWVHTAEPEQPAEVIVNVNSPQPPSVAAGAPAVPFVPPGGVKPPHGKPGVVTTVRIKLNEWCHL